MSRSSTKSKMAGFMTPNHINLISRKIWLGEKFVVLHTACVYNLLMIKIDGATHRSLSLKIPMLRISLQKMTFYYLGAASHDGNDNEDEQNLAVTFETKTWE